MKQYAYGFLKAVCFTNRHIFPNHISGSHAPKKNSTLAKIQEKWAKLKATRESTDPEAPTPRALNACMSADGV